MRRYNDGSAHGAPYDPARCKAAVKVAPHYLCRPQCFRPRASGPGDGYCYQHSRMVEAGKYVMVPEDAQ